MDRKEFEKQFERCKQKGSKEFINVLCKNNIGFVTEGYCIVGGQVYFYMPVDSYKIVSGFVDLSEIVKVKEV